MSAPIHSLLADELNLSDEKAKKLLGAMLREVRKRARSRGVRLPELGKFREKDGELAFEPSDSLARAVNHRFEGLDSEDLGSAPEQPEADDDESDEGPNTITLGYQDSSNWSPIEGEEESTDSESTDDDEPDTAEFEVPSADDAPDTEELQSSDETDQASDSQQTDTSQDSADSEHSASAQETPSEPAGSTQTETEELYPLVEDMPGESDEDASPEPDPAARHSDEEEEYDRERDSLSDIWGSDDESETDAPASPSEAKEDSGSASSSFDEFDPFDESTEPTESPESSPETEYLDQDPISGPEEASSAPEPAEPDEPQPEEPVTEAPATDSTEEPASAPSTKEKSTTLRVFATLLILILVGGSTWYILGQRGMAPPPRTTFAQLKAQVEPHVQDLPIVGSTEPSDAPAASSSSASASTTGSTTDPAAQSQPSPSSATESESASTGETTETSRAPSTTTGESSQQIDPTAGGWTIIVASRTQQGPAQSLVDDFRQRLSGQQVPIDVVAGNVENTTRYRVGVGQFESREAAQQFLDEFGSKLPDGAWALQLQ
jgi:hypothetical protein